MKPPARLVLALVATLVLASAPAAIAESKAGSSGYGFISGRITNVGAPRGIMEVRADSIDRPGYSVTTSQDNDGTYRLLVKTGRYRLTFWDREDDFAWEHHPGTQTRAEATVVTVKRDEVTSGWDADLEPGGSITGSVDLPPDFSPNRSNAYVRAYYRDGSTWRPVPSDPARDEVGPKFEITGLPPGTYRVKYQSAGGSFDTSSGFHGGTDDAASGIPVQVSRGASTSIRIKPRPAGTLSGRVLDADRNPIEGAIVELTAQEDDEPGSDPGFWSGDKVRATTDADGHYVFDRVETRDYIMQFFFYGDAIIKAPGRHASAWSGDVRPNWYEPGWGYGPPRNVASIKARAAATTTYIDQRLKRFGTLEGTVRDRTGRPLEGIEVTHRGVYEWIDDLGFQREAEGDVVVTDAEGRYSLGQVGDNPHTLQFADPEGIYSRHDYEDRSQPTKFTEFIFVPLEEQVVHDVVLESPFVTVTDTTPAVGQQVTATLTRDGRALARDPKARWTWQRAGRTITGATSPAYRPVPADRGARLTAVVTTPRGDREVLRLERRTSAVSTSRPTVTVGARSTGAGRVVLTVRASVRGVPASLLDGRVEIGRVRAGADRITTRTMKDGSLSVTLTGQPAGKRSYTATFLASKDRYSTSKAASASVRVR